MRSLAFVGDAECIRQVRAMAHAQGIESSSVEELDTEISRYQSPINLADVTAVLTTVTLIFSTGKAAVDFVEKVRELIRRGSTDDRLGDVDVRDAKTGAHQGLISAKPGLDTLTRSRLELEPMD